MEPLSRQTLPNQCAISSVYVSTSHKEPNPLRFTAWSSTSRAQSAMQTGEVPGMGIEFIAFGGAPRERWEAYLRQMSGAQSGTFGASGTTPNPIQPPHQSGTFPQTEAFQQHQVIGSSQPAFQGGPPRRPSTHHPLFNIHKLPSSTHHHQFSTHHRQLSTRHRSLSTRHLRHSRGRARRKNSSARSFPSP